MGIDMSEIDDRWFFGAQLMGTVGQGLWGDSLCFTVGWWVKEEQSWLGVNMSPGLCVLSWLNCCCLVAKWSEVTQSCPILCDPMDCSLPRSSVHGISQATVLEWGAISFSRGSSRPRDRTQVSRVVGRRFTVWATKEALWKNDIAQGHNVNW